MSNTDCNSESGGNSNRHNNGNSSRQGNRDHTRTSTIGIVMVMVIGRIQ